MRKSVVISLASYSLLALVAIPILGMAYTEGLKLAGLKTIPVPVVGTGSMYPSLFWAKSLGGPEDDERVVIEEYRSTPRLYKKYEGITIFGNKYFASRINRGDMVTFKNDKTRAILSAESKDIESGFIKRVIAVEGDTIELRDGFVYLNGELLSEPYITHPRSTYGGQFLKDCQKLTIPSNSFFVLGDNRKVSSDSRFELGVVNKNDISYYLPLSDQAIYKSLWRDPSHDDQKLGQPTLSGTEFVELVNELRLSKKVTAYTNNSKLSNSAKARGSKLLIDPQTSYNMQRAISDASYDNKVLGEFVSYGHFSAKELLENLLFNSATSKQILNSDFSDIGVTAVNMVIDGCPSQVIVGHMGGYIKASYDQSTKNSWKNLEHNLSLALPSWENVVNTDQLDPIKLSSLLSILYRRVDLAREIIKVMENGEWISPAQQAKIKADERDALEADQLISELNNH